MTCSSRNAWHLLCMLCIPAACASFDDPVGAPKLYAAPQQLGALCGLMPGAWILAVEAVITNNALLHSAEADASEALPCSQV